jgi:hypothetical protein
MPGQGKSQSTDAIRLRKTRFAGILKANGVVLAEEGGVGNVAPFTVERVSQSTTRRAYNISHG